jgi:hypothetical protein
MNAVEYRKNNGHAAKNTSAISAARRGRSRSATFQRNHMASAAKTSLVVRGHTWISSPSRVTRMGPGSKYDRRTSMSPSGRPPEPS